MTEAVIFNGLNSLDFQEIRSNVTRIPEVILRIREAQTVWEQSGKHDFDLLNFICSDNATFYGNIHLKSLASAVVQVGLYDRYLRFQPEPQFLIGNFNGDSALKVAAEIMSFQQMVLNSAAVVSVNSEIKVDIQETTLVAPVLSGICLTEFAAYHQRPEEKVYDRMDVERMDIIKIIHQLIEDHGLKKVINVGPGNKLVSRNSDDLIMEELQILESIDLDPMLAWFWSNLRQPASA